MKIRKLSFIAVVIATIWGFHSCSTKNDNTAIIQLKQLMHPETI